MDKTPPKKTTKKSKEAVAKALPKRPAAGGAKTSDPATRRMVDAARRAHGEKEKPAAPAKKPSIDPKLLDLMRRELFRRQEELQKNLGSGLEELTDEGHHLSDMEDLASDARDEATTFEIMAIGQAELSQVQWALKLMDDGKYGLCEECGNPINIERLRALPFATLCIVCKREQETYGH